MTTAVKKRRMTSIDTKQGSFLLGDGITVTRFRLPMAKPSTVSDSTNPGIRVYVTGNRSGVPQAQLDINSINKMLGRINLEDLVSISKNLQTIVCSLNLKRGQYTFRVEGKNSKGAFEQLKKADIGVIAEAAGCASPLPQSREEVVRAEIEDAYSPTEAGDLMCITRQALQKKRSVHAILGLKVANRYVYPKWQFDVSGQVIEGLAPVLRNLFSSEKNTFEVLARLNDRRPFLEGRSIKDCLIEGRIEDAEMASEGLADSRQ